MDKQALRKIVWRRIKEAGVGRFPGINGRIPNFVGSEAAAKHLVATDTFAEARTIKSNPDSPQRPVRHAALKAGKTVYVAVPKLAAEKPFIELDPERIGPEGLWSASSIKGADALGRPIAIDEMPSIDLIVTGCVGVTRAGARLGKGGGYADLEYGLLREAGKVTEATPIVTLVHGVQVLDDADVDMFAHDTSLDIIATPEGLLDVNRTFARPKGILWDVLDPEKKAAIPVLAAR